jgi:hypothetical protein
VVGAPLNRGILLCVAKAAPQPTSYDRDKLADILATGIPDNH